MFQIHVQIVIFYRPNQTVYTLKTIFGHYNLLVIYISGTFSIYLVLIMKYHFIENHIPWKKPI